MARLPLVAVGLGKKKRSYAAAARLMDGVDAHGTVLMG